MNRKEAKDRSQAGRFLSSETDIDPLPVVKGIQSYERALAYHREAHNHDASKDVKEAIAAKLKELQE